jgi:hypothetical protein
MNPTIRRRVSLGLTIHGPYSSNRRRRSWREHTPLAISAALLFALVLFLTALFTR